jgi:hypothetical protein
MRIVGSWFLFRDGVTRPTIRASVRCGERIVTARFLVDTGADRTALSAALLAELNGNPTIPPDDLELNGVSGSASFVFVDGALEFTRDDGVPTLVHGQFAALTDPKAIGISILGRDVTDNFDVIVSRHRDEVLLLATRHQYQIIMQ